MRYILLLIGILISQLCVKAQDRLLSIDELQDSLEVHPKPSMLLIHTSWCSYCKLQERQIYKNDLVEKLPIYLAEFDAETTNNVIFKNQEFKFVPNGNNLGVNQLVSHLGDNSGISYPFWIMLDEQLEIVGRYAGYLKPSEIMDIAKKM